MPAPVQIIVTASQKRRLRRILASTEARRTWSRATGLLMLEQGQSCLNVARVLGICEDTVTNWKKRWILEGLASLEDKHRSGRPLTVTARYLRLLAEAVERGPHAYDYLFSVWSVARLAAHLKAKTGIPLRPNQLRKHLKDLGFVYRRPKHSLKARQDPKAVRVAERHLHALKKGLFAPALDSNSGSRTKPTSIFTLT
jgi:transposase